MKKTFRKAIAVLLAVLMVAFSVPFSALAATNGVADMFGSTDYTVTQNRKWWVDDGVDISLEKLQSTPEYRGYANDEVSAGSFDFGAEIADYANNGLEDHRNDYKPVVAATVSNLGSKQDAEAAIADGTFDKYNKQYVNQYYGVNAAHTYEAVKEAGNIVNPAHVKAGQRIAITVEIGGFDVIQSGQFKGKFNTEYLQASTPGNVTKARDNWKINTAAKGAIKNGVAFYGDGMQFNSSTYNNEEGIFYGAITGTAATNGQQTTSNYIGVGSDGTKPFGKYGLVCYTYAFEVIKDCDLSEVFTFNTDIAGTEFEPYFRWSIDGTGEPSCNAVNPELYLVTHDDTKSTFANWALIWTDYAKDSTPEAKTYTITFTNAAGTVVDTQKLAAGATPVAPKTNTADTAATPAGNKQHSHTTYSWPAVSAVTANANYDEVAKVVTEDCTKGKPVVTEPTLDKPGSEVTSCTICGQVLETKVLPQLKGYDITVAKTAYGTTTLNSEDATNGKTTKVPANSTVTLTAQANEGAEFVGWKVANKLVSTNETYSFTAVADTEVTPVFTETAESTFVVVFIDMYGNVVSTQEVASGADIKVPATAPIYPGYTFKGWALTNDEITALTEGKTIRAIYEKDATQTYTVKAAGATITVNGTDYTDKAENVAYDAKVTVTKAGATSWTVNGATVGYGESYSFFCASDIELTAVTKADDTSKTQVAIVSTTRPSATDCDVLFVATRTVADNETVVSQGFVYGKNVTASDLTLENVGKTASGTNPGKVRVIYNSTNASQIGLNYGLTAKAGVAGARAFVVTKDADGNIHTYYSEASLYDYNA